MSHDYDSLLDEEYDSKPVHPPTTSLSVRGAASSEAQPSTTVNNSMSPTDGNEPGASAGIVELSERRSGTTAGASDSVLPSPVPSSSSISKSTLPPNPNLPLNPIRFQAGRSASQPLPGSSGCSALFLGELHWWTSDEHIHEICAAIGTPVDVKNIAFSEHKVNGKSKGTAYVEFSSAIDALKAKEWFDSTDWQGKRMSAELTAGGNGHNPFRTLPKEPYIRPSNSNSNSNHIRHDNHSTQNSSSHQSSSVPHRPPSARPSQSSSPLPPKPVTAPFSSNQFNTSNSSSQSNQHQHQHQHQHQAQTQPQQQQQQTPFITPTSMPMPLPFSAGPNPAMMMSAPFGPGAGGFPPFMGGIPGMGMGMNPMIGMGMMGGMGGMPNFGAGGAGGVGGAGGGVTGGGPGFTPQQLAAAFAVANGGAVNPMFYGGAGDGFDDAASRKRSRVDG
ncbi:hypothetical protein T439DRAFT_320493 [Meredithblackwellia eburnea MCA 4105]